VWGLGLGVILGEGLVDGVCLWLSVGVWPARSQDSGPVGRHTSPVPHLPSPPPPTSPCHYLPRPPREGIAPFIGRCLLFVWGFVWVFGYCSFLWCVFVVKFGVAGCIGMMID